MQRRYSLVSNTPSYHVFPIFNYSDNKFYQQNNLVDLDSFLLNQLDCGNKNMININLIKYYSDILDYIEKNKISNPTLKKTILKELKYLNGNEIIQFNISYKSNKNIKYLSLLNNNSKKSEYFLTIFEWAQNKLNYDKEETEKEISNDLIYKKFLNTLINTYKNNEQFYDFIEDSKIVNKYLKERLNDYKDYLEKIEDEEYIRENDKEFYIASAKILFQQLLTYKNIRNFLELIDLYNKKNKTNLLEELEIEIDKKNKNSEIVFEKMEELYKNGYDLEDFNKEDLGVYPDGLGIRKKW